MEDTIKDQYLEAIANAVPECDEIMKWIEDGEVSELVDMLIEILKKKLDEES